MRGVTGHNLVEIRQHSFQLTRLMRGVTTVQKTQCVANQNFNSHASCEA